MAMGIGWLGYSQEGGGVGQLTPRSGKKSHQGVTQLRIVVETSFRSLQ